MTTVERFCSKVSWGSSGCWHWMGAHYGSGYGQFFDQGKKHGSHRFMWSMLNGDIPPGMMVCHRCDNRSCVRPDHLFLGTNAQNLRDMAQKGRSCRGTKNRGAKLTPESVLKILADHGAGATEETLAIRYGVSTSQVGRIVRRENWKHLAPSQQALDRGEVERIGVVDRRLL